MSLIACGMKRRCRLLDLRDDLRGETADLFRAPAPASRLSRFFSSSSTVKRVRLPFVDDVLQQVDPPFQRFAVTVVARYLHIGWRMSWR